MSLLKRIEQGQGKTFRPVKWNSSIIRVGDASRLSSLQARRVSAPSTSPQAGTYFDLENACSESASWLNLIHPWILPKPMMFERQFRIYLSKF